jgi:hypothetical protein
MTRSRLSMQKSTSKSGMDTRSGFRKRSKRRSYGIGSMSVMRSAYATSEPAPEPRPGPTGTPLRFAPVDEVLDDEEVPGEAHVVDDVDLDLEARSR